MRCIKLSIRFTKLALSVAAQVHGYGRISGGSEFTENWCVCRLAVILPVDEYHGWSKPIRNGRGQYERSHCCDSALLRTEQPPPPPVQMTLCSM